MKYKKPEQEIKRSIMQWLMLQPDCFAWVNASTGVYDPIRKKFRTNTSMKGVADILGVYKQKPLAIEIKSKTGRVSEDQKIFLERFSKAGGIAFVARSLLDVIERLKNES